MQIIGTAAAGIRAQQLALDTVADNVANVNTPGFKGAHVQFAEALAQTERPVGATLGNGTSLPADLNIGRGVVYNGVAINPVQGVLVPADGPFDLAVDGEGFLTVRTPGGRLAYTRAGSLRFDATGTLVDAEGNVVQGTSAGGHAALRVPPQAGGVTIRPDGVVTGLVPGDTVPREFGQLALAKFLNPAELTWLGTNLYLPSAASGPALPGIPGTDGFGSIQPGMLEQSNVDLATAMTDMLQAQRAYQMNVRLLQDGDEMWGLANSIRR